MLPVKSSEPLPMYRQVVLFCPEVKSVVFHILSVLYFEFGDRSNAHGIYLTMKIWNENPYFNDR
jgi:hypothetical protein